VEYIISRLGDIPNDAKILDPCVGPGIFIKFLINAGVFPDQITAFDIHPQFERSIKDLGVYFEEKDTLLSFVEEDKNNYDFVVANPPYLNKSSEYVKAHRKALRMLYGHVNSHETYAMFIVNSIWRLKDGGKLGFITSDSFLTLKTHEKLRKYILNTCKIEELTLAPQNLFDDQEVSTSPAILILTKCPGDSHQNMRDSNTMRLLPRLETESKYQNPPRANSSLQKKYHLLPFHIFFTDIEEEILQFFEIAPKSEEFLKGYIGMHTHDNLKYIAAIEGTKLAGIFERRNKKKSGGKKYRIISQQEFQEGNWKPYLKRGGAAQYYRPIMEALDWQESSILIYDIPKKVPFEEEGIVISGVSSRLAARYMPKGCYWDSNKAIGFLIQDPSFSIEYILGLLNSSLYNYLAKGIINNTYSIQLTGIHALPMIKPNASYKKQVEREVDCILKHLRKDLDYDYSELQKQLDQLIFDYHAEVFDFTEGLKKKLDSRYAIYSK